MINKQSIAILIKYTIKFNKDGHVFIRKSIKKLLSSLVGMVLQVVAITGIYQ